MERTFIGSAVFIAVLCGQPVLLGAMCLYVAFFLLCTTFGAGMLGRSQTG